MLEAVALIITFLLGLAVGAWTASRWAGEAMGESIRREIEAGRLAKDEAIEIVDGMKRR